MTKRLQRRSLEKLADMRRRGVVDDDVLAEALVEAWRDDRLIEDEAMLDRSGGHPSIAEQLRRRLIGPEKLAEALLAAWHRGRLVEAVEIHRGSNVVRLR